MTRLAVALTLFAGGLIAVSHDNPALPSPSAVKAAKRPTAAPRVSRSHERFPLPSVPARPLSGKAVVAATPSAAPSTASRTVAGHLNWRALAQCESSGNPRAVSMGRYFGLYQFDLQTYASVGGTGNPVDDSPAEQTYRASLLYAERGTAPWPVCGWHLLEAA